MSHTLRAENGSLYTADFIIAATQSRLNIKKKLSDSVGELQNGCLLSVLDAFFLTVPFVVFYFRLKDLHCGEKPSETAF